MRKFYVTFPNTNALSSQLTWTHYRSLLRVENDDARNWYIPVSYESNEEMPRQYCGKNADTAKRYKLLIERIVAVLETF